MCVAINCMGMNCVYKGQIMVLFNIRNSYILRPKLPKTPIFLAKILLYSSYILGKTWLTACTPDIAPGGNSSSIQRQLRTTTLLATFQY